MCPHVAVVIAVATWPTFDEDGGVRDNEVAFLHPTAEQFDRRTRHKLMSIGSLASACADIGVEEFEEVEIDTAHGIVLTRIVYAIDPQAAFEEFDARGGQPSAALRAAYQERAEAERQERDRREQERLTRLTVELETTAATCPIGTQVDDRDARRILPRLLRAHGLALVHVRGRGYFVVPGEREARRLAMLGPVEGRHPLRDYLAQTGQSRLVRAEFLNSIDTVNRRW